jgi:ATP-dependent Clp protease adaptor protein ClpS
MLKVLIVNDEMTPMELVVDLLERVFERSWEEATKIMLEAHHTGQATCGVYPDARARELLGQATALAEQSSYPLQFSLAEGSTGQLS